MRLGDVLWVADRRYVNRGWNIYAPAVVPDLDEDGVKDIIIAHGGDPTVAAEVCIVSTEFHQYNTALITTVYLC